MRQLKITKSITNRQTLSLDRYLQDISKIELISIEEEISLAQDIKKGCPIALNKMVKANLRFVVSVAKQYQNQGLSLTDLINEGNLGLIKAAQRFDETRGFKFISYAVWWIRQSIMQAISEHSRIVRLPLNKISTISKVRKALAELEQKLEREPLNAEIALFTDLSNEEVKYSRGNTKKHLSMDAPLGNDKEDYYNMYEMIVNEECLHPDEKLLKESLEKEIDKLLLSLPEREAEIVRLFFGLKGHLAHNLEEIGIHFNLTRERVRQIKERAVKRLKQNSHCESLKSYLG